MHARSVVVALWRRRWTALAALVLTLVAVGLWLGFAPREYTAAATITATPRSAVANQGDVDDTVAALANSRPVLQDVRDKVGTRRSLAALRTEVHGQRVRGTELIRVLVRDRDAAFARRVANAVADTLPLHDPTGGALIFTDAGRATTPQSSWSPDIAAIAFGAVGVGIVLAILAGLAHEWLGGRIDRAEQVTAITAAPVLGRLRRPVDPMTASASRAGPHADDWRRVRVALEFAGSVTRIRTIVVAPAAPDLAAGWSTVNLAISLAEVQHRVLLIDADFGTRPRHPVLASKADGLVEVLAGHADLAEAIVPSDVEGLYVLPIGDTAATGAPAWVEMRFHPLLRGVSEDDFDVVLVHAAPISESADPLVLAAGNSLLVVVPAGSVRAAALRRQVAELHSMRLRLVGTVLLDRRSKR